MARDTDRNADTTSSTTSHTPALALRERRPGHAVMFALLTDPALRRPCGRLARIIGRSPLTARGRDWYRGALGEIAVGRMLTGLDARWRVLHADRSGAESCVSERQNPPRFASTGVS